MKRTYDHTLTIDNEALQTAPITILAYSENKYKTDVMSDVKIIKYTGLKSWDIITGGKEAEEIESETDESGVDDHHEYLVLHFNDGSSSTFRNSYVDLMIKA